MSRGHLRRRADADPGRFGFDLDDLERPLDPDRLFAAPEESAPESPPAAESPRGRSPSLEVEIGSGRGSFLIAEGEARPGTRFLGVERARRYWLFAADRLRRRERTNARILRADALEVFRELPPGSVAAVWAFFPDPWPKRRHSHRRLLARGEFYAAVERSLAPGGAFRVVTDAEAYLAEIETALSRRARLCRCAYRAPVSAEPGEFAGSNFERKYRREGRPIHAAAARLRPADGSADEDDALPDEEA